MGGDETPKLERSKGLLGLSLKEQMARTFAIGDIHGKKRCLEALIVKLKLQENDCLVFLGDYIDRGEDSKGVIDFLLELSEERWCIFLKGNHEDMLLSELNKVGKYGQDVWLQNGGLRTLASYGASCIPDIIKRMSANHRSFLDGLRDTYEDSNYFYVHAGLAPDPTDEILKYGTHLWIREAFIDSKKLWPKKIIFGDRKSVV